MIALHEDFLVWFERHLPSVGQDCALHGLQIEGKNQIERLGFAVSLTEQVFERALHHKIDALIVHHGIFWAKQMLKGPIFGALKKQISFFLKHDISLIGAHLPLDLHPQWGNNVILGQKIGLNEPCIFEKGLLWRQKVLKKSKKDFLGECSKVLRIEQENLLSCPDAEHSQDLWVGWCTGAGSSFLEALPYCDIFITGEVPERSWEHAKMNNTLLITLGHDASEIYGIEGLKKQVELDYGKKILTYLL